MSPLERLAQVDAEEAADLRSMADEEAIKTVDTIVYVLDGGNEAAVRLATTFQAKVDAEGADGAREVLALVALAPSRTR